MENPPKVLSEYKDGKLVGIGYYAVGFVVREDFARRIDQREAEIAEENGILEGINEIDRGRFRLLRFEDSITIDGQTAYRLTIYEL